MIDFITCSCQTTFVWVNNTGCICGNSQALVIGNGLTATCLVCNSTIYAASKYNSTTCRCVSTALVWSGSTHQCACAAANSVIFLSIVGVYSCVACNSTLYAVSSLTSTSCNCISSLFIWSPNIGCIC